MKPIKSFSRALKYALEEGFFLELDIKHRDLEDTRPNEKKARLFSPAAHSSSSYSSDYTLNAILYCLQGYYGDVIYDQTQDAPIIKNMEIIASTHGAIRIQSEKEKIIILLNQRLDCPKKITGATLEEALANARK